MLNQVSIFVRWLICIQIRIIVTPCWPDPSIYVEILELDLGKDDKFIVIASDGVWEFISNDEIAKIVKPFFDAKNAEKAAEAVVKESYLRWKREEEGIVDDITCVIVFLDVKLPQQDPSPNLLGIDTQDK